MSLGYSDNIKLYANVTSLASANVTNGEIGVTIGRSSPGVGGSSYRFIAGDTTTADGGFVISGNGGRWHLIDKTIANVILFGASGDGTSDDTAAIQAAVNTGLPVYFPAGTYKITDAIEFGSNFIMYGDGPGRSEVKWDSSTASQVMFKNNATVTTLYVYNLRFRHRADSTADWSNGGAVLTNSGKTIIIENCDFIDMSTTALDLVSTDDAVTREDVTVVNCRAWCDTASFYTGNFCKPGGGRTVIFRGNHIRQCARGISLEQKNSRNFYEVIITDNVFVDSKVANKSTTQTSSPIHLSLESGTQTIESVIISNNIIRNTDGINGTTSANYGIGLTCSAGTIKRAIIAQNIIDTWSGRSGSSIPILVKGVEFPIVSKNIISDVSWSSTAYRGMVVQTYSYGVVTDNLFKGSGYSAPIVIVGSLANCEVNGNFCSGIEIQHNQAPGVTWATLSSGVANPDVTGLKMAKTVDAGANTITSLNNGSDQQILRLWLSNNNTTLQHNSTIKLQNSTTFTPSGSGAMFTLYCDNGVWRELSRVVY